MRKYDVMYIIRPTIEAEARKALIEELNAILTSRGATDLVVNEWGTRELAYEIKDFKKGYYVVLTCQASVEGLNEFDRVAGIKEDVLRHIIVSREEK
ncbi:MAG: 30S ribosomal protein S6 [Candidatus Izemoplasmatales bacterium]|jgi:small subunit ribosomal protein S6|nr:30S ribosomal protein S6 [Candidatus Izemoplasmatales bacterium]MDD3865686.1 30S ribosomal protein S6 [Candidatus Izemoplasmatales bacterium]